MAIRGAGERVAHAEVQRVTSLLEIATLIARDAPEEIVFATAAEQLARCLETEAASVLRFVGDERAVVVGVWSATCMRAPGSISSR